MKTLKTNRKIQLAMGIFATLFLTTQVSQAQVKIGEDTTPVKGAVLDLSNSSSGYVGGLKLPSVSITSLTTIPSSFKESVTATADKAALAGLLVYNTNTAVGSGIGIYYWDGAKWVVQTTVNSSSNTNAWLVAGNTNGSIQNIGTKDNFDLPFVTDGSEKMRLMTNGYIGIRTDTPEHAVHLFQDGRATSNNFDNVVIESYLGDSVAIGARTPAFDCLVSRGTYTKDGTGFQRLQHGDYIGHSAYGVRFSPTSYSWLSQIEAHYRGDGETKFSDLRFSTSGLTPVKMIIDSIGYVGIGTTKPNHRLEVVSSGSSSSDDEASDNIAISSYVVNSAPLIEPAPSFVIYKGRGSENSPRNLKVNDQIGGYRFFAQVGSKRMRLGGMSSYYVGDGTTGKNRLHFMTCENDAKRMIFDENGNLGIGMGIDDVPSERLHVKGGDVLFGNLHTGSHNTGTSDEDGLTYSYNNHVLSIQRSEDYSNLYLSKNQSKKAISSSSIFISFTASNTTGGYSTLGSIRADGSGGIKYNETSDKRLKENVVATHYGINDLMKIEVKDYNFKSDINKTQQIGFLAQDLFKIFPDAVSQGGENPNEDPWGVDYGRLTPLLVKAIQDQQEIIKQLETRLKALENK